MRKAIGESWVNDGPEDTCFGCGHANPRGLRLRFTRTGERTVECRFEAAAHWCGAPGIVHGGVQAALLDEVLGTAGHCGFDEAEGSVDLATVDFRLRYLRPCPAGEPLHVLGELLGVEGRDVFVGGEIRNLGGDVLTRAEARWRRVRRSPSGGLPRG